jgi:Leucine-rich repeat (LRR) protein
MPKLGLGLSLQQTRVAGGFILNFWTNLSSTAGKVITGFNSTFTNAMIANWGDGTTTPLTSGVSVNKTLGTTNAIGLDTNNAVATAINCGTSSPRLGGTVDISAFPSLQQFICNSNDITALSGYAQNSNLTTVQFFNNSVTGLLPSLSTLSNLTHFYCHTNLLTGSIPSLSSLTSLRDFRCQINYLSGPLPSLNGLTNLTNFYCATNELTGSIPSLSGLTNLRDFQCHSNELEGSIPSLSGLTNLGVFNCSNQRVGAQLTGSIPSLSTLNNLRNFYCHTNQLTGSIPSLSSNWSLLEFYCFGNQLTGSIPNLSTLVSLLDFRCQANQLTGFAGGSVANTLGNFQAQTNQLNSTAVNAILAAFVAANKTTGTRILNLGGTGNSAPTGQGITDKATLISRGWTVTTN